MATFDFNNAVANFNGVKAFVAEKLDGRTAEQIKGDAAAKCGELVEPLFFDNLPENLTLETAVEIVNAAKELEDYELDAFCAYVENFVPYNKQKSSEDYLCDFRDRFLCEEEEIENYISDYIDEIVTNEFARRYFNEERFLREMDFNGEITLCGGYYFWNY